MSDRTSLAHRFRRYNEALFALDAAKLMGWAYLNRIQLQKILYLCEMLAPFRDVVMAHLEYRFHYKGPYARDLQNSVDHLLTRGLAELVSYSLTTGSSDVPTSDDQVEVASYRLTSEGQHVIESLVAISSNEEARELVFIICELTDLYGLGNVVNLVYQEPTFHELRVKELRGHALSSQDGNLSIELLQFLDRFGHSRMGYQHLGWKAVFLAYFDFLWAKYTSRMEQEAL